MRWRKRILTQDLTFVRFFAFFPKELKNGDRIWLEYYYLPAYELAYNRYDFAKEASFQNSDDIDEKLQITNVFTWTKVTLKPLIIQWEADQKNKKFYNKVDKIIS